MAKHEQRNCQRIMEIPDVELLITPPKVTIMENGNVYFQIRAIVLSYYIGLELKQTSTNRKIRLLDYQKYNNIYSAKVVYR